jgi:hypothetical protein
MTMKLCDRDGVVTCYRHIDGDQTVPYVFWRKGEELIRLDGKFSLADLLRIVKKMQKHIFVPRQ